MMTKTKTKTLGVIYLVIRKRHISINWDSSKGNIEVNTDTKVHMLAINMVVVDMVIMTTKDDFNKSKANKVIK